MGRRLGREPRRHRKTKSRWGIAALPAGKIRWPFAGRTAVECVGKEMLSSSGHIERPPRRLVEDLIKLDIYRSTGYLKPALDCLKGKMYLRLFKPGQEAEGVRCALCLHSVTVLLRIVSRGRCRSCGSLRVGWT